jgi:cell division protein FtsQ
MKIRKYLILILPLLIFTGAYYAFKWRDNDTVEKIFVEGNITIEREEILKIARLTDTVMNAGDVNIDLIQDRVLKHPEVKKVFVSRELPTDLKIQIVERKPVAIINSGHELLLVDDELEIFPFKNMKKIFDLPLISGIRTEIKPNVDKFNKDDLRLALYIIINSYKKSKFLYNNISEVNLSKTDRIILYLSEDSSPVYLPRRNDVTIADKSYQNLIDEKLDVLTGYVNTNLEEHVNSRVNYVDLRFSNHVVVNSNN